ncbi:hypothetical protein FQR65_LT19230 [Abscondita terminalis]|nr:hypothetical protein FQR65_LT19230 [Abscondita terminalis]
MGRPKVADDIGLQMARFLASRINNISDISSSLIESSSIFAEVATFIFKTDLYEKRLLLFRRWVRNTGNVQNICQQLLDQRSHSSEFSKIDLSPKVNIEEIELVDVSNNVDILLDQRSHSSEFISKIDMSPKVNNDEIELVDVSNNVHIRNKDICDNIKNAELVKQCVTDDSSYTFKIKFNDYFENLGFKENFNYNLLNEIKNVYSVCALNIKRKRLNPVAHSANIALYCVYNNCRKVMEESLCFLSLENVLKYLDANIDSRCIIEGEAICHAKHTVLYGVSNISSEKIDIIGLCLQTSNLKEKSQEIKGQLTFKNEVCEVKHLCSCKAELSNRSKHLLLCLFYAQDLGAGPSGQKRPRQKYKNIKNLTEEEMRAALSASSDEEYEFAVDSDEDFTPEISEDDESSDCGEVDDNTNDNENDSKVESDANSYESSDSYEDSDYVPSNEKPNTRIDYQPKVGGAISSTLALYYFASNHPCHVSSAIQ